MSSMARTSSATSATSLGPGGITAPGAGAQDIQSLFVHSIGRLERGRVDELAALSDLG